MDTLLYLSCNYEDIAKKALLLKEVGMRENRYIQKNSYHHEENTRKQKQKIRVAGNRYIQTIPHYHEYYTNAGARRKEGGGIKEDKNGGKRRKYRKNSTDVYMYVYMHIQIHMSISVYIHTCAHILIHVSVHIYA